MQRLRNRFQGFTLIELMIVVAILGILAAVAVPAFLKYIRDSKTAEAEENLKSIGDGALTYYQEEHADTDTGMSVTTRVYPENSMCTTSGLDGGGSKMAPNANWEEWKVLRFTLSKPHYYKYCYNSPGADAKTFDATAQANLAGDGTATPDSEFVIRGSANSATGGPELSAIIELK